MESWPSRNPCALITCSLATLAGTTGPEGSIFILRLNRRRPFEGEHRWGTISFEARTKNGRKLEICSATDPLGGVGTGVTLGWNPAAGTRSRLISARLSPGRQQTPWVVKHDNAKPLE